MGWLIAILAGCLLIGNSQVRQFESAAATDISGHLAGDQRVVNVKASVGLEAIFGDVQRVTLTARQFTTEGLPLYTEPERSQAGHLRLLSLHLSDFSLRGLHVETLDGDIPDCRFDFTLAQRHHQIRLSRSGTGPGRVVLSEKDIEDFIKLKFHEIQRATVRLEGDKITIEGHGQFVVFDADFWLVAKLGVEGGTQLTLSMARILIDGQPASADATAALLQTLNPVIDLNRDLALFGAIQIQHLEIADHQLIAEGKVTIPVHPG